MAILNTKNLQMTDTGSNALYPYVPATQAAQTAANNSAAANSKANNSAVNSALNKSASGVNPNAPTSTGSAATISNNSAQAAQITQPAYAPQYYTPAPIPDYSEYLRMAQEAAAMARAQAIEASVRGYETYRPEIAQQGDAARAQAYQNSRISAIGNNELLAAQGLAGGMYDNPYTGYSETSRVAQDNTMRTNLQTATQTEQQAYAELDRAIAQLRANGQMAEAEALASNAQAIVQLMMQQQQMEYEQQMQANQFNFQQQQYANQLTAQQQSDALNKAQTLAGYGDFSGYGDLGWDTSSMQSAYALAQQQAAAKASGTGSSGSSGTSGSNLTYTQALSAYNMGITTPEVLGVLNNSLGEGGLDMYAAKQEADRQAQEQAAQQTAAAPAQMSANEAYYRIVNDNTDPISVFNKYAYLLTPAQQQQAYANMRFEGYTRAQAMAAYDAGTSDPKAIRA